MANHDEYRARAQRFLTGPFHVDDLKTLFLFLRRQSFGRESVRDIGNMIGHSDERDRDITVVRVNEMYQIAKFHFPPFRDQIKREISLDSVSADMLSSMQATLNLLTDDIIMRETGLRRSQANAAFLKIRKKFTDIGDGRLKWSFPYYTKKDHALIKCLNSFLISIEPYGAKSLICDLEFLLLKHSFIDHDQISLFRSKECLVKLFAVTAFHGTRFLLEDGMVAEGQVGWVTEDDGIARLLASVSIDFSSEIRPNVALSFAMMKTDLPAVDWSEGYDPTKRHSYWSVPIDLTSEGKLRCIG